MRLAQFAKNGMPRYYFHIEGPGHDDDVGHDPNGTIFVNDATAFDYAQRIIRELREAGGYDDPQLTMLVKSEAGRTIFAIPFN